MDEERHAVPQDDHRLQANLEPSRIRGKAKATATELYLSFGLRGREPEKPRTYPSKNGAAVEQRIKRLDHEHSRSRSKSRGRASSRTKARSDNSSPIAPHHDKVSKRPHLTRGYSRRRRWERQNPTRIGLHHLEPFPRSWFSKFPQPTAHDTNAKDER